MLHTSEIEITKSARGWSAHHIQYWGLWEFPWYPPYLGVFFHKSVKVAPICGRHHGSSQRAWNGNRPVHTHENFGI